MAKSRKKSFEVIFILDRSGSMHGLESDTIGGYNSLFKKYSRGDAETTVTTVLFDDQYEILHNRVNINAVKPITNDEYYARGQTALLDAIGKTMEQVNNNQNNLKANYRADKVVFVIITDGLENASSHYSLTQVKKMVQDKRKSDWEFIFFGANINSIEVAGTMGIDERMASDYDASPDSVANCFDDICKDLSELKF